MPRAPIDSEEIGKRLETLRKATGLTPADVGRALGLSAFSIREKEEGRALGKYIQLADLAGILGTTPDVILGIKEPPSAPEDLLNLMGAAMEAILIEAGWSADRAEEAVEIAIAAAREEPVQDVDRRLSARSIAVSRIRQREPRR